MCHLYLYDFYENEHAVNIKIRSIEYDKYVIKKFEGLKIPIRNILMFCHLAECNGHEKCNYIYMKGVICVWLFEMSHSLID